MWTCLVYVRFAGFPVSIQIVALEDRVGLETEATVFTDHFWQDQQIIINALDNIQVKLLSRLEGSWLAAKNPLKHAGHAVLAREQIVCVYIHLVGYVGGRWFFPTPPCGVLHSVSSFVHR